MLDKIDSKVFGGTMLIAGTTIGAGMLAMPIMTGLFGFFGTLAILIACWLFMYWTATLILEASLQFGDGASFVTMANKALGKSGAAITWVTFLLLFYSLVAAYLSGSGRIIVDAIEGVLNLEIPPFFDILPLLVIFAPFIYFGLSLVDHLNRWLMFGMLISYAVLTFWLMPSVDAKMLAYNNWSFALLSFSVVVTSFGYQVLIPTLVKYLDRDIKRIKISMFYGSFIPLVVYIFWELGILGAIPVTGEFGLAQAFIRGDSLAKLLSSHLQSSMVATVARAFSVFAIVTSFLGVAQALFDFLKDGLNVQKSPQRKSLAFALTFLPPILMIIALESSFIALLEYAGALVSIILGIIPIIIVWRLRIKNETKIIYRAPGNNAALFLGVVFFIFVVLIVLLKNFGLIRFVVQDLV